jgi:SAM-dependent methyltransferase
VEAVREAYDAIAEDYAEHFRTGLDDRPLDRALLNAFGELVRATGHGSVADVGCGPGWTTAFLHKAGVPVVGIDLSPGMLTVARRSWQGIRFDVGSMLDLDLPDGSVGGVLAYYSIIHVEPDQLPVAFAEFHRVLTPGGQVFLAFQVGDEPLHLDEAFGHTIDLDFRRLLPDHVAELLGQAGFAVHTRVVREPMPTEKVPQAYLLASKI